MSTRKRKPLSQIESENNSVPKKSKPATFDRRAGAVNRIVLKNFMCHSLLEVNFSNNVSFITGKNGSGKSAILTALIIGLGGKASLTNRGSSVKGFVKVGKTSGSIEIELCNEGPMAYKPNVYGNVINVLRNISASGSGSYKIRSSSGELISTLSGELHNITLSLNIQVDNPICILNQDTSRNFLSSSNPKNKFSLFMKATKLEDLEVEYKKIQANKKDSVKVMDEKSGSFKKLQEEIKQLKRKIDNQKSIISLKDRKTLLQRELIWAKVRDAQEELDEANQNLSSLEKKLNDFKANSAKSVEHLKSYKEHFKQLGQQLSGVQEQIATQGRALADLKTEINELARNASKKKIEKQQILTSIENRKSDIESLKQDIMSSKESMTKVQQQKSERIKNLASLQNKLKGLDDHLETSKNDLFQMKGDRSRKEDDERNLIQEITQIDQKINKEKNILNGLRSESGNQLSLYGKEIPAVRRMIAQHKFRQEPRGPLGSYIKVKNKEWTLAVEGYIGPATLRAFAVDNKEDNQLLRQIFNKVLGNSSHPQIITSKFISKKHDVSRNLVYTPQDCVSVYDAIDIDDPVVSNCIIDGCSPENILLIPSDERAIALLQHKQNVPRNCHQGITVKGDKYYPDPNYRTYASSYHRAQYLQVDTKEHMEQLQESINKLKGKKQVIINQLEEFRKSMREQTNKIQQLEEKVKKVNQARHQIRNQLEELNSTAEPEVQNVQFLEQELEQCKQTVNEKSAELDKVEKELKEIKRNMKEKEGDYSQLKDSSNGLEERTQALNKEIRENQTKQKEMSTNDDFEKSRINEFKTRVEDSRANIVMKQNQVKKRTVEATAIGEPIADLRQVTAITNEINDIAHRISCIETDSENVADVMDKYNELSEKFRKSVDIMKSLQTDINELSLALDKRSRHYKLTESYFVTYMKYSFKKILEYRQFKGTLDINIANKKLDLIVIPQHGSQGHTTTSNLSGGERSFSTVAFLYSLWQCMELPFYFLDEFDVYMDKLNRTKVIDILLHHAKSKSQLQFVFLTPQDISFINQDVSILRLEDPERFNF